MKPRPQLFCRSSGRLHTALSTLSIALCLTGAVNAASGTWSASPADANWNNSSNWSAAFPNAVTETATFSNAITTYGGSANPVSLATVISLQNIAFSGSAGSYVIGAAAGTNALSFRNSAAGGNSISVAAAVTNPQVIAAPVTFTAPSSTNGAFTFVNNSTTSTATLSFTGAITANTSSSRPGRILLDGSNAGDNIISSNINSPSFGQDVSLIVKNGTGTWILSGSNTFSGTSITSATATSGIVVNSGVLSVRNNNALGTSATAGQLQVRVNGGTLDLASAITLDNGVNLNLNNGGTLRSTGSNAVNSKVTLTTAAAATASLTTVGSADVLTIGNATNDLTGGATDTVLNVGGPGTIALAQSSNYAGTWSINNGTLQLGNNSALGAAATTGVTFGASSAATLKLNGFSPTVTSLTTNATPGTPSVVNGTSGTSTLTVNNASNNTFAGSLSDGAAGVLALTKGGAGTLTLNGSLGYTGATTVSSGTLAVNSPASTASVAVNSGSTLSGTGTINGTVTVASTSHLAPGNGVGTLTMGSLTLASGSIVDCEFKTGPAANDLAVVTTSDGLNLDGGGFNLYQEGTTSQFNTPGTYTLITYTGTSTVSTSNLSILNPDATKNYAFSADATSVKLTITPSVISNWALTSGGDWGTGANWTGAGVPNASGSTAILGSALTAAGTVTLNGDKTVSTLSFDNANSYTVAPASTETLFLDNTVNSGQAQLIGTSGSHQVTAPVSLTSNTVVSVANAADTISLGGVVSGAGSLSKSGPGTLLLGAANTYEGGTSISNGTVTFATGGISTVGPVSISTATLKWAPGNTDDISLAPSLSLPAGNAVFDTNGNDVALTIAFGSSGAGNLVKAGAGKLSLPGGSNYAGSTTVNGGTLSIAADSALGSSPGAATPGSLTVGSATLQAGGTFTLNANRGIALSSSSSSVDVSSGSTLTYNGVVAGSGKLNLTGTGTLNLGGTNTYSGGTLIPTGSTLNLSGTGTAGTGQVALQGGTIKLNRNLYNIGNIFVDASQSGTIDGVNDRVGLGGLTGSGSLTLISRYGGSNVTASAFGFRLVGGNGPFTGTLNLKSGTGAVSSFAAYFNGGTFDGNLSNATVNLTDNARIGGVNNSGGNTTTIGALTGDSTAILGGADYAGTHTYNIGGKNLDTTFPGTIANGSAGNANLIKSGTGSLTLTGANTYFGTTAVNLGSLIVGSATALGSDTVGTTVAGGDVNAKVVVSGGLTVTEPWTLAGRQGTNADTAHLLNTAGANVLSGLVSPATGGNNYNVQSDAGNLTVSGGFLPAGAVTGARSLQLLGDGNGEWSGAIQNGTATVSVTKKGNGTWILSGANSYTGDTNVNAGTLNLSSTGELKFTPTTSGTSNKITGAGTVGLDGKFNIDLTGANVTNGNSWLLVDVDTLTETYGSNFSVTGFTKSGTNWVKVDGANTWTFSQTTGALSLAIVTDPFIPWIATYFPGETNAAIIGKAADPDNDGRNNLAEFAFNSNPSSSANDGKVVGKTATVGGSSVLTLTLPVRTGAIFSDDATTHEEVSTLIDGVIYRIQGSADLSAWTLDVSEIGAGADRDAIQLGLPALDTGWSYRTFRAPGTVSSATSDFLRVKVTE